MTTTADWKRERAREKAIKAALDHFDSQLPGRFKGRAWAHDRIRENARPLREAKRLVTWFQAQAAQPEADLIDFSDVQEIRVRVLRRDGVVDEPQALLFARMDRLVATGGIDRERFTDMAAAAVAMKPAIPSRRRESLRPEAA